MSTRTSTAATPSTTATTATPPSPHPNLAPLDKGPFHAIPVHPGDIGTKGGLVTDADARVLREDGSPVPGLYAAGNCSAAVMGETYPGPGATIGPAMAFAWAAVNDMAAAGGITGAGTTSSCSPGAGPTGSGPTATGPTGPTVTGPTGTGARSTPAGS
ncbi:FAD-binding protein [Streptomyces sp. NPDC004788]